MQFLASGISVLLFSLVFINSSSGATSAAPEAPKLCVNSTDKGEQCSLGVALGSVSPGTYPRNISEPSSFHPGHWVKVADPSVSYMSSLMNKLEGTNIRGIEIWHSWDKLEPGSPGDYSGQYWDQLDAWMKQAQSKGLSLFIRIRTHQFAYGGRPATPAYMKTNKLYGGSPGVYGSYCAKAKENKCTLRPAWHDPDTVERAKALISEFKRRWGAKNHFEGVGLQESAPGSNAAKTPGWSAGAHSDGIVAIMSHAKNIMPNKAALPSVNWHPNISRLLRDLAASGIGLGCPDLPPDGSNPLKGVTDQMRSRHANEDHSPGVSGRYAGTLGNGWTLAQVYNRAANDLNVWRIIWDDDWINEGLIAFASKNELPSAKAFY